MPIEDTFQNSQTRQITHYERLIAGKLLADELREPFKELGFNVSYGSWSNFDNKRRSATFITAYHSNELRSKYGPRKTKEKLIALIPKTQNYEELIIPIELRIDDPSRGGFLSTLVNLYERIFN